MENGNLKIRLLREKEIRKITRKYENNNSSTNITFGICARFGETFLQYLL